MAATIIPQSVGRPSLTPAYVAATSGGDKVQVGAKGAFLHVKNGGGSSISVTVTAQNNVYRGRTVPDTVVAVPATSERMIPLDPDVDVDINGQASITYTGVTTVTVAAFR